MEKDNSDKVTEENQQGPAKRKLRITKIIIWTIFIVVAVLCLVLDSYKQRLNNEIIRITIADQLDKKPSELTKADYLNLTELDLSKTTATDIRLLKKCPNLQTLNLEGTPLELYHHESSIRVLLARWGLLKYKQSRKQVDLSTLKYLKNLRSLYLFDTSFKNITFIKNLKKLEELNLQYTDISDIKLVQGLTGLQKLILDDINISDINPVKNLINLEELSLSDTKVTDIQPLKNLTQLQILNIERTNINNVEPLKNLENLKELYISNTQVYDIEPLKKLINIEKLDVSNTHINNIEFLKEFHNLRELWCSNTLIPNLEPLKNLTKLKRLLINNCPNITTEQVEDLKKALPNLKVYR